jgi:hypothetical protein
MAINAALALKKFNIFDTFRKGCTYLRVKEINVISQYLALRYHVETVFGILRLNIEKSH